MNRSDERQGIHEKYKKTMVDVSMDTNHMRECVCVTIPRCLQESQDDWMMTVVEGDILASKGVGGRTCPPIAEAADISSFSV